MSKNEIDSNVTMRDMKIFNEIRNCVGQKINNTNGHYYDIWPQKKEILDFIQRTVEFGKSDSAIICGPPGCGKTALVEHILEELKTKNVINEENALIIKLNGLLHTDDKLALKDIKRQLKLAECCDWTSFSSFQENLIYVFEKLKDKKIENAQPCILFILDEFHLFCGHKKQLLLYNLFDVIRSTKATICVIGMTYSTDIKELLEKRILSRFSDRIIWLDHSTTINERLTMFKNICTLSKEDLPGIEKIYRFLWNLRICHLIEDSEVIEYLKKQLEIFPSQTKFRNLTFQLISTITFELPLFTAENIKTVFTTPDYYLLTLSGLSVLEAALVIAIKHQTLNTDREPFNFEMIYAHFLHFCKKNSHTLPTDRPVILKGYEKLSNLELIIPAKKSRNILGKVFMEYQLFNLNLTDEQVNEGLKLNMELTKDLKDWAFTR